MPAWRVNSRKRQHGITLIEVLAAVTVLAIVLIGTFRALEQQSANTIALANRAFGHWVALNSMEEARLEGFADEREVRRTTRLGGVTWTVTVRRESGPDGLTRLMITSTADGRAGAFLVGFVPPEPAP